MSEKRPFVAILMGSDSDLPVMRATLEVLDKFSIPKEVKITSAHRTPEATRAYIIDAEARGCAVFIAAAGLAAHLAGAVAATTMKPVIGVPLDAGPLSGMDALLATVQMPGGIPVGCVAIGKAGAKKRGLPGRADPGLAGCRAGRNHCVRTGADGPDSPGKGCGIAGATGRLTNPGVRVKFLMRGSGWNKESRGQSKISDEGPGLESKMYAKFYSDPIYHPIYPPATPH